MKYKKGMRTAMCSKCGCDYLYKDNGVLKIFLTEEGKRKTLCSDCYEVYMTKWLRKKQIRTKETCFGCY